VQEPVADATRCLVDRDGRVTRAYDATGGAVYLVRPDGHVGGRWRAPDRATLQRALARACGRELVTLETLR
jgi:3-(3-hydroxy-phenyl)propionate hydroxylase